MNTLMMIEMLGYFGSFLIVISMLMTSVKKLRVINTVGSIVFVVYAFLIRSYPTAFLNLCIVIINTYNVIKLSQKEEL